ncbi:MAG: hypothetical protein V4722_06740 [Bacteroidota bacterium]
MKKIYITLFTSFYLFLSATAQIIIPVGDELLLPQYAYYGGVRAANRMPIVCRLKLTGLATSSTYRYMTGMSGTNNLTTTQAPGNMYRINNNSNASGYITGFAVTKAINSTELNGDVMFTDNTSRHGRFTTDASGSYTGWFACVPVGNLTQQVNGSDVYFYVNLNNGGSGTTLTQSFRTTSTARLLNYSSTPGDAAGCTALLGTSDVGDEKMVAIYDNTSSTGRPLYCTFTENNNSGGVLTEGTLWNNPVIYPMVDNVSGSWAAVIPNSLSGGVKAINFFNIDGTAITLSNSPIPNTSSDGTWNGISTANPAGDSTVPISINSIASTILPVTLLSFSGEAAKEGVKLYWKTSQELNNKFFEISRAGSDGQFQPIGNIHATGTPELINEYSFTDPLPHSGKNFYRLKQVDKDGRSKVYNIIAVTVSKQRLSLRLVSAGNVEIVMAIQSNENRSGNIIYTDIQGSVLYKRGTVLQPGENIIRIPVAGISKRIGVVSFLFANGERTSLKVLR